MSEREEKKEVDEPEEEKNFFVVDPEDYQKTRKLKAINDAKKHVRKLRRENTRKAPGKEIKAMRRAISKAVATYGSELIPLIEQALDEGTLEEEDLECKKGDVTSFVLADGTIPDHENEEVDEYPNPITYMTYFRQLQRIERKLGLGLELEEDKGPANI